MKKLAALVLITAVGLSGCTAIRSTIADFAVSTTSASPTQAKTVAEATQLASAAEHLLDIYVLNGHPSKAVLEQLNIMVPAVHNALKKAQDANRSGNSVLTSLALDGFNQALDALNAYKTLKGVS